MNIYIDESGSFVSTPIRGSWSVVAAFVVSESSRSRVERAIRSLKKCSSTPVSDELKLHQVEELNYLHFLKQLAETQSLLFATATDAGTNEPKKVVQHQTTQAANVRARVNSMHFESGKHSVKTLADELEKISPQLYIQLVCQVDLMHDIISRAINYFVQRDPTTLSEFRWRIDQKNTSKTTYERAFEKIAPALLQTRSLIEPLAWIKGYNYKQFTQYEFPDGKPPGYLKEEYGIHVEQAINVQKLIRGNFKFEDSKRLIGIQVADLLASGLRKCLRGEFKSNSTVADALGRLTLQNQKGKHPIHLISFAQNDGNADQIAAAVVKSFRVKCRPFFV